MMTKTNECRCTTRTVPCAVRAAAFMAALYAIPAQAAQIGVQDDVAKTYTVTVASGNTVELSDEDAAALLALDAGYTFVKAGTGKLVVSNQIAAFAGPIVITNGTYEARSGDALGVGGEGAETHVRTGASLCIYNKTGDGVTFSANESISIAGVGYNNKGALYSGSGTTEQKKLLKNAGCLVLDADATICGDTIGFSGGEAYLGGHELTVSMGTASSSRVFNLTFDEIKTAGDIRLKRGRFFFDGTTRYAGGSENTLTADDGTSVAFRNATVPVPWALVVDGDVGLYPSNPKTDAKYAANVWSGPVILNGRAIVDYSSSGATSSVALTGPVSGTGSFVVNSQNALHLSCPTNTFTGGVIVAGSNDSCTLTVDGEGTLPPSGGALEVRNGTIQLTDGPVALPAVNSVTVGSAIVTNISACSSVTTPSLTKDGTGILKVYGGIDITNTLSVCTGKVELVGSTTNAQNAAGLYLYSTNFADKTDLSNYFASSIGVTFAKGLSAGNLRKVFDHVMDIKRDSPTTTDGVDLAFNRWAASQKTSMYAYTGYFRNLAETNVTVTFGLSIWDVEALWIDGENLLANVGTKNASSGSNTYCLQLNDVRLTPGPHKIEILLGHWTSSNGGANSSQYPNADDPIDWPAGHGFVLRYGKNDNNRFYANGGYIDVKNGETLGTILTRTADPLPEDLVASGSRYRAEFANLVGRAAGTLDLGGDMFPRPVNGLSGTLTVMNGALEVTGAWTATREELTASPLVVAAGTQLTFREGATFVPDESLARGLHQIVIAETVDDGVIEGCPRCESQDWATHRVQEDGKTRIYLSVRPGFKLILR